jgi:hypothetical protein
MLNLKKNLANKKSNKLHRNLKRISRVSIEKEVYQK